MSLASAVLGYLKVQARNRSKRLEEVARRFQRTIPEENLKQLEDLLAKRIREALEGFKSWKLIAVSARKIHIIWDYHGVVVNSHADIRIPIEKNEQTQMLLNFNYLEALTMHVEEGLEEEQNLNAPWTSIKAAADKILEEWEQIANAVAEILEELLKEGGSP